MRSREILQQYLDRVGDAVLQGDLGVYLDAVRLPFLLATERARLVIETPGDLEDGFESFVDMLRDMRVTHYVRSVEAAVAMNNDMIAGRYVTHMMSHGRMVVPAFRSQIVLRLEEGRWQAESISNNFHNGRWPIYLPDIRESA